MAMTTAETADHKHEFPEQPGSAPGISALFASGLVRQWRADATSWRDFANQEQDAERRVGWLTRAETYDACADVVERELGESAGSLPGVSDLHPGYLDNVAAQIGALVPDCPPDLLRIYALLARVTGVNTTSEHVHDGWSAWRASTRPDHPSLVPFSALPLETRRLDDPYRDAICTVASRIALAEARRG